MSPTPGDGALRSRQRSFDRGLDGFTQLPSLHGTAVGFAPFASEAELDDQRSPSAAYWVGQASRSSARTNRTSPLAGRRRCPADGTRESKVMPP